MTKDFCSRTAASEAAAALQSKIYTNTYLDTISGCKRIHGRIHSSGANVCAIVEKNCFQSVRRRGEVSAMEAAILWWADDKSDTSSTTN